MEKLVTVTEIKNVGNKIVSISKKDGNVNYNLAKYFYNSVEGFFVVILRKGMAEYLCHPTNLIPYVGKKGVHFQTFKTANAAAKFINKIL
jgi:hypothetical protein